MIGREVAEQAKGLLPIVSSDSDPAVPQFSIREQAILEKLGTHQDKEIAQSLSLTVHGVRYHIRNIFRKLEVSNREEAVRRARDSAVL